MLQKTRNLQGFRERHVFYLLLRSGPLKSVGLAAFFDQGPRPNRAFSGLQVLKARKYRGIRACSSLGLMYLNLFPMYLNLGVMYLNWVPQLGPFVPQLEPHVPQLMYLNVCCGQSLCKHTATSALHVLVLTSTFGFGRRRTAGHYI